MRISKAIFPVLCIVLISCQSSAQKERARNKKAKISKKVEAASNEPNEVKTISRLPKQLKEISGIVKDSNSLWAISDDARTKIYRLDFSGKLIQEVKLKNDILDDIEAIAADNDYLYIADIGDNDGVRKDRRIIRIKKSDIGSKEKSEVSGEIIAFTFPKWHKAQKKEENPYDAEALICYKDALYIFTKRRNDEQTELLMLPKTPGKHVAKPIALFNSNGLITGAAMNRSETELALVGYHDGHQKPFIWLLSDFKSNNFFSGKQKRFELTQKEKDWQMEGIAFKSDTTLFLSCEETKDEPATLYIIDKRSMDK